MEVDKASLGLKLVFGGNFTHIDHISQQLGEGIFWRFWPYTWISLRQLFTLYQAYGIICFTFSKHLSCESKYRGHVVVAKLKPCDLLLVEEIQVTTWHVKYPVNNMIDYLGAGVLPSTVAVSSSSTVWSKDSRLKKLHIQHRFNAKFRLFGLES